MVDRASVSGVSAAIVSNVGFVGMRSRPANDNAAVATVQQMNNIKGTALQIVKYLVSIDASLKAQVLANTYAYNQNVKQERENLVEQYRGFGNAEAEPEQIPDATPVQVDASSSIGVAVAALTAGAVALSYSAYKLYDMFQQSVTNAMGSLGALVGLGAPTPERQEREIPEPAPIPPAPKPQNPPKRTNVKDASSRAPDEDPGTTRLGMGSRGINAPPESDATAAVRTSAPPVITAPPTPPSRPAQPVAARPPASQATPTSPSKDAQQQVSVDEIPKNDIVALGHYLIGKGADRHQLQHSAFGPVGEHSKKSRHYRDMAIDVNFPGPNEAAKLDALEPKLRAAGYNTIWRKPGHKTHMHVSVGGPEGSGSGSMLGSTVAAVTETFEDIKRTMGNLASTARDKMQLMPVEAEGVQSKAIQDNIARIKNDAEERERDILSAARKAAIIHKVGQTPTQQEPPPPPPPSARGKSVTVVGDYFERFLGVSLQPNQIGLG